MTTGYLAAGSCWPTANEAIDAYYSSQQMEIYSATAIHFYRPLKDGSVWKMSDQLTSGATSYTYTLPTNVYGTCTLAETSTGTGTGGTTTGTVSIVYPPVTYDYAAATAAWTFAVTIVVGTWMIAKNAGAIINAIRNW